MERVYHLPKDPRALILSKMVEDAIFVARQIETLMFSDYVQRIQINLFTDSEGTLESIASTNQIERKSLGMAMQDMKEGLIDGEIELYQLIPTYSMWAYFLNKEMEMHECIKVLLTEGNLEVMDEGINKVQCLDGEIEMTNIRNMDK